MLKQTYKLGDIYHILHFLPFYLPCYILEMSMNELTFIESLHLLIRYIHQSKLNLQSKYLFYIVLRNLTHFFNAFTG